MGGNPAMLQRPGAGVHAAIRALYESLCYAVPCSDCEAMAGEPCRPYRLLASRSGCPPTAVATIDPHGARRKAVWPHVHGMADSVRALRCPVCGGEVDTRYPGSPLHVCPPVAEPAGPTLGDDVSAVLGGPGVTP